MKKTLGELSIRISDESQNEIYSLLKKHKRVRVLGLGTFEVRKVKEKKSYHNFSNKVIKIPAHNRIHFLPVKGFTDIIR